MLMKERETGSGVRLEVNEKILDSCTQLIQAVLRLVRDANVLQKEIVSQGRGTASEKEFYKRHHQWTEGLFSAAKAVGLRAHVLVDAADRVVNQKGKFEELVVASQEVAASTAQLVIASIVKADKDSKQLKQLEGSSRNVTSATATVVATAKTGQQTLEEAIPDFSALSLHASKRLEMETQVNLIVMINFYIYHTYKQASRNLPSSYTLSFGAGVRLKKPSLPVVCDICDVISRQISDC
ncbi:unnamed protein product [Soboliphyme baturini]|uniref:I/LWEQ domain-containing protein n=1 Tax=Soboliphyme baturini TaxID=241478 RepID=A0A183J0L8_9BILA|nr:unnamed protein product [Soboliphyme baturini]